MDTTTTAERIATAHRDAPMGRARIHYTIIKGTTPRSRVVTVVAIEGDRLTYTDDGIWQSTITRNAGTGWALIEELAPAPATLDSFRAAWATRLATTRTATTLTMSEHWGLRALMGDDSMPLARNAARQTMAVLTDTGV